jgi:hypothetical protein
MTSALERPSSVRRAAYSRVRGSERNHQYRTPPRLGWRPPRARRHDSRPLRSRQRCSGVQETGRGTSLDISPNMTYSDEAVELYSARRNCHQAFTSRSSLPTALRLSRWCRDGLAPGLPPVVSTGTRLGRLAVRFVASQATRSPTRSSLAPPDPAVAPTPRPASHARLMSVRGQPTGPTQPSGTGTAAKGGPPRHLIPSDHSWPCTAPRWLARWLVPGCRAC